MHKKQQQSGITLLITLLLTGVLLGVSATLLNVTLKQFQLSNIALESETAFQAANAGIECALYYDQTQSSSPFSVPGDGNEQAAVPSISCMGDSAAADDDPQDSDGDGLATSGDEQMFTFNWGTNPTVCTQVSVYKFYEDYGTDADSDGLDVTIDGVQMRDDPCPEGSECTVIQSRGYNVGCNDIYSDLNVVEREYTQVY